MEFKINLHLITLVFVILKLAHVISWSWWWVFAPSLLFFALAVLSAILLISLINKLPEKERMLARMDMLRVKNDAEFQRFIKRLR
jgi:MFS superfamily sulfate permease-like transporter